MMMTEEKMNICAKSNEHIAKNYLLVPIVFPNESRKIPESAVRIGSSRFHSTPEISGVSHRMLGWRGFRPCRVTTPCPRPLH